MRLEKLGKRGGTILPTLDYLWPSSDTSGTESFGGDDSSTAEIKADATHGSFGSTSTLQWHLGAIGYVKVEPTAQNPAILNRLHPCNTFIVKTIC